MADIAKISVSGIQYDIKDETARNKVTAIEDGTKTLTSVTTSGNASVGGTLNVSGTTTLSGNLTVTGDITQSGSSYETHAEQVYTKKDMIITRDGATGGLGNNQYTGIQAKKYDGTNDGQLVFDKDGIARVGDVGQLQALATREDTPSDNYMPYWDAATNKFVTTLPTFNILCGSNADADCVGTIGSLTGYVNGMTVKVLFTNGHYGSTFTLNLDSQGAKPIWVNKDGTPAAMASNSLDRGDGTARNWFVQPYTTLELMYVSSLNSGNGAWLVIGNPVVLSSTASGYTIYADGFNENRRITTSRKIIWDAMNTNISKTYTLVSNYFAHIVVFIFAEDYNGTSAASFLLYNGSRTHYVNNLIFTLNLNINNSAFNNSLIVSLKDSTDLGSQYSAYCIIQN